MYPGVVIHLDKLPVIYVVFAGLVCYYRINNLRSSYKDGSRRNAEGTHSTLKRRVTMNYRDFEMARKKERTKRSHLAIIVKMIKERQSRPRATKNIFSDDPRLQKI